MAYTGNNLSRITQTIEGNQGEFFYVAPSGETLANILAVGYFSDGNKRGMQLADQVFINIGGVQSQCYVSAINATTGAVSIAPNLPTYLGANFRNVLDGGDATINPWQRGTSFSNIGATNTYTADRMFAVGGAGTSGTVTKTANTSVLGFSQMFAIGRAQSSSSTSTLTFGQVLESLDSIRLQGQPVTMSFWASANTGFSGANLAVELSAGTGTDQSASSLVNNTWTNQTNPISTTQVLTTSATRYQFFGTVPASATQVGVTLAYTPQSTAVSPTGDNFNLWGWQLELGTGATPFEHRDIQLELEIAQRYFFQINEGTSGTVVGVGAVSGTNAETIFIPLPVQMRAAPTVTVVAGSFAFQLAGALVAVSGFAAGALHTVNFINLIGTTTGASGGATYLVSRQPNSGSIAVTADL